MPCPACLAGRPLARPPRALRRALRLLAPPQTECDTIQLCWECRATLKRIQRFQSNMLRAQRRLREHRETYNPDLLTTTSTLQCSTIYVCEMLPSNHELIPVKIETTPILFNNDSFSWDEEDLPLTDYKIRDKSIKMKSEQITIDSNVIRNISNETRDKSKCIKVRSKESKVKLKETEYKSEDVNVKSKETDDKSNYINDKYESKDIKVKSDEIEDKLSCVDDKEIIEDKTKENKVKEKKLRRSRKVRRSEVTGGRRKFPAVFNCKVCGQTFGKRGAYEYHKERHLEKPQCEECGRTFVSKSVLWAHRKLEHSDCTKHMCCVCKRVYFTEEGYRAHVTSHLRGEPEHYCAPCNKFFKTNSNLRKHQRSSLKHTDPITFPYGCVSCDRRFPTEERAKEHHDVIHLNKNKYACKLCPREYCTARALRIHEQVKHEKVARPRDKVCEVCGKGFQTSQTLKSHIRTHTGERPYSCRLCPSKFAQSGALHTHTKLVHLNIKRGKRIAV